jgi:hypothetical protein
MKRKTASPAAHFSVSAGLASIGQIWPSGDYEEFVAPSDQQAGIANYWHLTGEYLYRAERKVRHTVKD